MSCVPCSKKFKSVEIGEKFIFKYSVLQFTNILTKFQNNYFFVSIDNGTQFGDHYNLTCLEDVLNILNNPSKYSIKEIEKYI